MLSKLQFLERANCEYLDKNLGTKFLRSQEIKSTELKKEKREHQPVFHPIHPKIFKGLTFYA